MRTYWNLLKIFISKRTHAGSPAQVEAAYQALEQLHIVTAREAGRQVREADDLGLTGRDRWEHYAKAPESDEYLAANTAAGEALRQISGWQEIKIRARLDTAVYDAYADEEIAKA